MKYLFALSVTLFAWKQHTATHLVNALEANSVSMEMFGAKEVPQAMLNNGFAPKLQMELENHTGAPLKIEMEEGYLMEPTSQGYQVLLMTQPMMITLQPKQKSKQFIYAMCTQLSMSSPNSQVKYKVGKKAPDTLLKLAQFIAQKNYQNAEAQRTVWCISDNSPILSLAENDLRQFVATLKGVDLEKLKRENSTNNLSVIMADYNGKKLDRNIVFRNDSSSAVSVGYFNEQGEMIKPFFENVTYRAGYHSIRYNPFPLALANKHYSVRMMKDGEVYREYYFMQ